MKRLSIIVWSLLTMAACAGVHVPPRPTPTPPPAPAPTVPAFTERTLAVHVYDGAQPIAGCAIDLSLPLSGHFTATPADGYAAWLVKIPNPDPGGGLNASVSISCPDRVKLEDSFVIAAEGNQDIWFGGTAAGNQPMLRPGPVSARPRLVTVAESPQIRANFGSNRGCSGELIFQPFIARAWLDHDRARIDCWMKAAKDEGLTYFTVLMWSGDYPGYPLKGWDFRQQPEQLAALIKDLQQYPAADGGAFRFIVYLDSGDSGGALAYSQVPRYAAALKTLDPYIVVVQGFETFGQCSDWGTSANLQWQQAIAASFSAPAAVHGCPGRLALSSHPLEADDPFQGDEPSSYLSHGGELPRYVFFQFEHGRPVTDPCGRTVDDGRGQGLRYADDCALGRFDDVIARAGAGICTDDYGRGGPCGWRNSHSARPLFPVAFEGCTMDLYHGATDIACDQRLADAALKIYTTYGVTPMFGSGLPSSWRPAHLFPDTTPRYTFTFAQR